MTVSRREFLGVSAAALAASQPAIAAATNDEEQALVESIRDAFEDGQAGVDDMLLHIASVPGKVVSTLGEPTKGGIRSLYHSPELTILNIVWSPLMVLRPHNHNMWASIGVYGGREDNIYWRRNGATVEAIGARSLGRGQVGSLGSDGIHSVINPSQNLTAAIHVYGGDFFAPGRLQWEGEDLQEAPFSQSGLIKHFKKSNERFGL